MSQLVATLSRLPLFVAILAAVLALGLAAPAKVRAATLVSVESSQTVATSMPVGGEEGKSGFGESEQDADPHPLPDAVLSGTLDLPLAPSARLSVGRKDREFPSRLASLDRPPSWPSLALRGGRPG